MTFLLFSSSKCRKNENCPEGSHSKIIIKNNSTTFINWQGFFIDSIYRVNGQPRNNILKPSENDIYSYRTCWEEYFNTINNEYQYFLIFDNDTIQAIGWQSISGTNRGLLKKIKVDLNYLKANDFTITYP